MFILLVVRSADDGQAGKVGEKKDSDCFTSLQSYLCKKDCHPAEMRRWDLRADGRTDPDGGHSEFRDEWGHKSLLIGSAMQWDLSAHHSIRLSAGREGVV